MVWWAKLRFQISWFRSKAEASRNLAEFERCFIKSRLQAEKGYAFGVAWVAVACDGSICVTLVREMRHQSSCSFFLWHWAKHTFAQVALSPLATTFPSLPRFAKKETIAILATNDFYAVLNYFPFGASCLKILDSKMSFYGFEWAYFRGLKHENGDVVSDSVRFTLPSAVVTPKLYRIGGNNCSHAAQRCHPDFVHSSSSETSRFQFHYSELSLWVKCHPNRPKSDNVFFEKISTKRITLKSFSWIRANLFRTEKN